MGDQRLWCSGLPGCPCERHTGPSPDRRITIDPTDEAVVARVAAVIGRIYAGTLSRPETSARAVLSALADGVGS